MIEAAARLGELSGIWPQALHEHSATNGYFRGPSKQTSLLLSADFYISPEQMYGGGQEQYGAALRILENETENERSAAAFAEMKSDVQDIKSLLQQHLTICGRSTTDSETLVQQTQRAAPSAPAATPADSTFAHELIQRSRFLAPGFNLGSNLVNADGTGAQLRPQPFAAVTGPAVFNVDWIEDMATMPASHNTLCAPAAPAKYASSS